jgi:hypothetical protein
MAQHTLHQAVPTDVQRVRARRPFPLNVLTFSDRAAGRVRLAARVWIAVAVAVLAFLAWLDGIPTHPERGAWDLYAQLGLLGLVIVGAVLTWRWEGAGATLIMLSAAGLGALSAAAYTPLRAVMITLLFFVPAVLFWLVWQRIRPLWKVAVLAVVLGATLGISGYAADRVYATYFGPVQPGSQLALAPATTVDWIWAGAATDTSAVVKASLISGVPDARLLVSEDEGLADARAVAPEPGGDPTLLSFAVDRLTPDTDYWYAVEAGGTVDTSRQGHLRTFPAGPASFTFAFGSCADTGSNGAVFDTIREANPLFFVQDGDFFYDDIAVNDPAVYRAAYAHALGEPAQSALYRSLPVAYTWDDHDYGANNSDATSPSRDAAIANYDSVVPHYPLAAGAGGSIYQAFTVGRVRFIVTDNYTERTPAAAPDGPDKTMLGAAQKAWLEQELLDASGKYPVIVWVNSQPWIVEAGAGAEGWGSYATERHEISDFIVEHNIQGLAMISGDAHMIAYDDGSNNTFASNGTGPGFPVFHASALDRHGSVKGGPYSGGTDAGGGHFGLMTVTDDGGDTIEVSWSGRNYKDEELMHYSFTVQMPEERG